MKRRVALPADLKGSPINVTYDEDTYEYQVRLKGRSSATYFTDDFDDAISTARAMLDSIA